MAVLRVLWKKRNRQNSSLVEELPEVFVVFFSFEKKLPPLFLEGDILCPDEFANARATLDSHTISAGKSGLKGS